MFSRGEIDTFRKSVFIFLVISIVVFSMAVHFLVEGLMLDLHTHAQKMAGHTGKQLESIHEHSDDHFIHSSINVAAPVLIFYSAMLPSVSHWQSLAIPPQFPPPNI